MSKKLSDYTAYTSPLASTDILEVTQDPSGTAVTRKITKNELSAEIGVRLKAFHTLTDSATVTWDMDLGNNAVVTLGGNRTLAMSNIESGDVGVLKVIQDGTGSRTLTLPASSKVIDGGAGAITLTTTASAVDFISFVYDGTNYNWNYGVNYN